MAKKKTTAPYNYKTVYKEIKCYKCGFVKMVDEDTVKYKCALCTVTDSIDVSEALQLQKESEYTRQDWIDLIHKKETDYQNFISSKRDVSLDEIVEKRNKKMHKKNKLIKDALTKRKKKK